MLHPFFCRFRRVLLLLILFVTSLGIRVEYYPNITLELSRSIHIVKHNNIYVIYKVLVYVQYKRLSHVHTPTPCILHKYSCVFDYHIYIYMN